jgi:uncharacterized protein
MRIFDMHRARTRGVIRRSLLAAFICAATAVVPQAAFAQDTAVEARNRQFVTEAFQRWADGGSTFFADVLAPDVVWTIEGSGPSAGVFRGRDEFLKMVRPFASRLREPIRPVSTRVWADGDHVIVNWEGVGQAGDGARYENRYAWIFRMEDGRAVEVTAFLDLVPFDDVLRRVPEPAPQP